MAKEIIIKGARTHNLKNINLVIPKEKFCVITGLSGSGKSSLAFDTIYAEGQRKYVESLSAYARQFLQLMDKPDIDHIEGLSPSISIEQKSTSHNPRSTVGTITEIYDYLRLLYARIGTPKCPLHKTVLKSQTIKQMIDNIIKKPENTKIMILSPIVRDKKGEFKNLLENLSRNGFVRARIDDENYDLSDPPQLALRKKHNIDVIIDRLKISNNESCRVRIADSLETALNLSNGLVKIQEIDNDSNEPLLFSSNRSCFICGYAIPKLEPNNFSFNNPNGACETCGGLGIQEIFKPQSFIIDPNLSLNDGAIKGWSPTATYSFSIIQSLSRYYNFDLNTPYKNLPNNIKDLLFYGNNGEKIEINCSFDNAKINKKMSFDGIIPIVTQRYTDSSTTQKDEYAKLLSTEICPSCHGERLKNAYRNVFVDDTSLPEITQKTIRTCLNFFDNISLSTEQQFIASKVIKEISNRLNFLTNVGLDYLTLNRMAETLSGGEAQRIRLASQIGSGLTGVMYVLDEPSIGLHQKDNDRLLQSLQHLKDLGNTLIVVEHDEDTIRQADFIVDIGPGAGINGGYVVASGTINDITNSENSLTGQYLSKKLSIEIPPKRKKYTDTLLLENVSTNNLKNINVKIPLGIFTCITGVSGSGKSSLINDTLFYALQSSINGSQIPPNIKFSKIIGQEKIDKIINIDQSPIGRTPRSNVATYIDMFSYIRELFSKTHEARVRGYTPGRFSFNVKGGWCEACQGDGVIKIEMNFLPTVYITCSECAGKKYNKETLDILYKGKNINDILNMNISEAILFFGSIPQLQKKLQTLIDVGLSYITLGQSATTFSGGEAQRIKLAKELSRKDTGQTLYILDEPTTGLHFHDVKMLLSVLNRLRDSGNTIVVIEHNLDVIKNADYIIDIGPDGGNNGGEIIASGTPEQVAKSDKSYTGKYLNKLLNN